MSAPSAIAPPAPSLPRGIRHGREVMCLECPTPCARQLDETHHADPCAVCPLVKPRWLALTACGEINPSNAAPNRLRGLGDVVALVADPIAKAIGFDKAKCGCAKRQEMLNRAVPFIRERAPLS